MRSIPILCVILLLWTCNAMADCEKARELFQKAMEMKTPEQLPDRIKLLNDSIEDCKSFAAYYELGKAHARQGSLDQAYEELVLASRYAENKDQAQGAWVTIAQAYNHHGKSDDAIQCYKQAMKVSDTRKSEIQAELMALEKKYAGTVMPSSEIKSGLKKSLDMTTKSAGPHSAMASIDVRVNFQFDSTKFSTKGEEQVAELMKAVTAPEFEGVRFKLIGHTDKRGTDPYNLGLSSNRAAAVRDYLKAHAGVDPSKFSLEGKGKEHLLYDEDTDTAHALNRRVEIVPLME